MQGSSPAALHPEARAAPFQLSCHQSPIHTLFSQHLSTTDALKQPPLCVLTDPQFWTSAPLINQILYSSHLPFFCTDFSYKFLSQACRQPEPHRHCNSPPPSWTLLARDTPRFKFALQIPSLEHQAPAIRWDTRLSPWWGSALLLCKPCSDPTRRPADALRGQCRQPKASPQIIHTSLTSAHPPTKLSCS